MASFKTVMKSGHPPTLFAAFLYFDFCFAIWVLNGAMGPFITETFKLSPAQTGFMISLPILAGALMRFPLGVLAQYIGRKNAAITEMSVIMLAMAYGYLFVSSYNDVLAMGVLLGIAGASFGVALSLGSGWFPPEHKGLAMGIAGAGNSGTVLAVLFAPPLAQAYGYNPAAPWLIYTYLVFAILILNGFLLHLPWQGKVLAASASPGPELEALLHAPMHRAASAISAISVLVLIFLMTAQPG